MLQKITKTLIIAILTLFLFTSTVNAEPQTVKPQLTQQLDTLPLAKNSEVKLQANTVRLLRAIEHHWPYYKNEGIIGGYRPDPYPYHPSGQALDIMMPNGAKNPEDVAYGNQIAQWLLANAKTLGIQMIIWRQHIYNMERDTSWRKMDDRNNWTANHMDHIHVDVYGEHEPEGSLVPPGNKTNITPIAVNQEHQQKIINYKTEIQNNTKNKTEIQNKLNINEKKLKNTSRLLNEVNKQQTVAQTKINQLARNIYITQTNVDTQMLNGLTHILLNGTLPEPEPEHYLIQETTHTIKENNNLDTETVKLLNEKQQLENNLTALNNELQENERKNQELIQELHNLETLANIPLPETTNETSETQPVPEN